MKTLGFTIKMTAFLLIFANFSFAGDFITEHKVFNDITELKIKAICGDWTISSHSSNEIVVDLKYSKNLKNTFYAEMNERNGKLKLGEDFDKKTFGKTLIKWTIKVPELMDVDFSTASGDLNLKGIKGDINGSSASGDFSLKDINGNVDISTASGDIEADDIESDIDFSTASGDIDLKNVSGELDFSTASGDIEVSHSSAEMNFSCASGDITLENSIILGPSSFSTASGDINLSLKKSPEFDLKLSTASGNATLDYDGNSIEGRIEMTSRKRTGRIISPFSFDKTDEYKRNGTSYETKSFTRGTNDIQIIMKSSSGTLKIKK